MYKDVFTYAAQQIQVSHWFADETLVANIDFRNTHCVAYPEQFDYKIWSGDKAPMAGLRTKRFTDFTTMEEVYQQQEQ